MRQRVHGHYWTLAPFLAARVRPPRLPLGLHWETHAEDATRGHIRLTGRLHPGTTRPGDLIVLVHGLGGSSDSEYLRRAALAVARAGVACLRLNLRGADRSGADIYHAGLTADLHAALQSPALAAYPRVHLLGFSLGGHVTLRLAAEPHDPRLRAVASICAPLDLAATQHAIDRGRVNAYREHVLRGLKEIYAGLHPGAAPTPHDIVRRVRTIHAWDRHTVVPRFGFRTVATYYEEMSAGPRLPHLRCPALVIAATGDPMVPVASLRPYLDHPPPGVTARITPLGGHVGFPPAVPLHLTGGQTVDDQVIRWLLAQ